MDQIVSISHRGSSDFLKDAILTSVHGMYVLHEKQNGIKRGTDSETPETKGKRVGRKNKVGESCS